MLAGRRIVLGVTGGIAAYKAIEVTRRLVDAGAHVSPILTKGSLQFVGKTTFSALASEPVQMSLWDEASPIPHTRLGQNADLIVVCPATARLLADYRMGRSHDLLNATLIATRAPVVICPAMHTEMWEHPSVQDNMSVLGQRGVHIVPPEEGRLAGGDSGAGRLADPATIVARIDQVLTEQDLAGVRVVVSAGGTRESLDPVRFLGNRSTGKQGYALAERAAARGADVTLVTTVDRDIPPSVTRVVEVETTGDMYDAMLAAAASADVLIMAAAPADFRPASVATDKIKKTDGTPEVVLERTPDILAALGEQRREGQTLVGFAAETTNLIENARSKLERKNADLIVANDVSAPGTGFRHDTNQVVLVGRNGATTEVPLADKTVIADAVLDRVAALRLT